MTLVSMVQGLVGEGVRFVVGGGIASIAHGATFVTNDLDICYDAATDNTERLASLLRGWDAYLRGVEPGLPFTLDARMIRNAPILTLRTREGDIDLMDIVAGVGAYDSALARSDEVEALGVRFRALSLDALIAAKRASGRPKDRLHLVELEAIRELRRAKPKRQGSE